MENMEAKMQGIKYYDLRLNHLISVYKNKGIDSLIIKDNRDKIERLVQGYKKFKSSLEYDKNLVGVVETFILGI
jgi:hypothetical protein